MSTTSPIVNTLDLSLPTAFWVLITNGIPGFSFNVSLPPSDTSNAGTFNFYTTNVDFTKSPNTLVTVSPQDSKVVTAGKFADGTNSAVVDSNTLIISKYVIVGWVQSGASTGVAKIEGIMVS